MVFGGRFDSTSAKSGTSILVASALVFVAIGAAELPSSTVKEVARVSDSRKTPELSDNRLDDVRYSESKFDVTGKKSVSEQAIGGKWFGKFLEKRLINSDEKNRLEATRRGSFFSSRLNSHYRPKRDSVNSKLGRKTITIVPGDEIVDLKQMKNQQDLGLKEVKQVSRGDPKDSQSYEVEDSPKSLPANDVVYHNTLEICNTRLTNRTNETTHTDTSHEEEHKKRCSMEIASGVPALWVIFYILIIFFLFIGLAIICDDFFIASLETISQKLNLSEDVAGATFMAAGSSAPELFISIAGAGAGSDVGVGTIVGSAVFNLLIIIALTAALAGKELCLDWKPFVRDSVFYSLSIIMFIVFSLDAQFQVWESLLLLGLYVFYIVVMKFNSHVMNCMNKWKCCYCFEARVAPEEIRPPMEPKEPEPIVFQSNEKKTTITPLPVSPKTIPKEVPTTSSQVVLDVATKGEIATSPQNSPKKSPNITKSASPSRNVTPVETLDVPKSQICSVKTDEKTSSTSVRNDPVRTTPVELQPPSSSKTATPSCDKDSKSTEKKDEKENQNGSSTKLCTCIPMGIPAEGRMCTCCIIHISNQPCLICAGARSNGGMIPRIRCSSCSSIREDAVVLNEQPYALENCSAMEALDNIGEKITYLPNAFGNGVASRRSASLITIKSVDGMTTGTNKNSSNNREYENNDSPKVLRQNYMENGNIELQAPPAETSKNDVEANVVVLPCLPAVKNHPPEKPVSSECIPGSKYVLMYIVYLLSFPWACAFTWTVPKCDNPSRRKWYIASFLLCITWIALLSWVMIELVEKIGCLLRIDSYTMGLIVVAVGTSVPDAISSILVAKDGCGDMAVSNALGSNVFDINLGLGLPFFLGSVITSKPISLMTPLQQCLYERLPLPMKLVPHVKFGIILLVILLIAVGVFMFVRFRLNKKVTFLFVGMYVVFMIYAFVQEKSCHSFFC